MQMLEDERLGTGSLYQWRIDDAARRALLVMPRGAPAVIGGGPVLSPSATLSGGGLRPSAW
jgi:hypothetical protein